MNAKIAISTLVLASAFAGAAFAETPWNVNDNFTSTRSRDEVNAELSAYKKAGVNPWATSYNQLTGFHSVRARADVTAEYMAARNEVNALNGEDSGSQYLAQRRVRSVSPTHLAAQ
jgi:hypothetical protein